MSTFKFSSTVSIFLLVKVGKICWTVKKNLRGDHLFDSSNRRAIISIEFIGRNFMLITRLRGLMYFHFTEYLMDTQRYILTHTHLTK